MANLSEREATLSETEFAIGRACGVTFAGIKPASLVSVRKRGRAALARIGRCFRRKGFSFVCLRTEKERQVLYIYNEEELRRLLFSAEVRAFLGGYGYHYETAAEAVTQLRDRMEGEFPHEIGVFLGYPLCDVRGFIADPCGCLYCGAWKVYRDVAGARRTFERYKRCSACICRHMQNGRSLAEIFRISD